MEKTKERLNQSMKFDKKYHNVGWYYHMQRSPSIKIGLGFNENQNKIVARSNAMDLPKKMDEYKPKCYVITLKNEDNKKDKNEEEYKVPIGFFSLMSKGEISGIIIREVVSNLWHYDHHFIDQYERQFNYYIAWIFNYRLLKYCHWCQRTTNKMIIRTIDKDYR